MPVDVPLWLAVPFREALQTDPRSVPTRCDYALFRHHHGQTVEALQLLHEALEATDGRMPVPKGPGIGVTLDRAFLDKVTVATERFPA